MAHSVQDLPPVGGYAPIQYKRNLPIRGPRSSVLLLFATLFTSYGLYKYIQGVHEKRLEKQMCLCFVCDRNDRELKREDVWSRIHLIPLLQAEVDRDIYRRRQAMLKYENKIMQGTPEWSSKQNIYHTDRDVAPTFALVLE